ncbi:Phospholipase/carboxylesterase family protein [plant metagenome]|uniref:Phospholipase/carboxylesterase family protein n=2 Tax=root TaxID=1 RepID=A0A1C3JY31_9BURK|nr:esterase [Orrella dioscoreae]SBT24150.1 Phospholipase/carboxylesterase family protein [Orrella dioscoreae]SOE51402.1 Phospholipase/carboxylesterase family protein [Orrella dioscoreae]
MSRLESIVVQQPAGDLSRLVLLMHGVGSVPQSMLGVADWFARRDPRALVVSVASPEASDLSPGGLQWFSVRGVTEENRQARVDAAMPGFTATVDRWRRAAGVSVADTLIAGFSQGAIMALESTKLDDAPAGDVVAFAGRYASLPTRRPTANVHLLHGDADAVMPVAGAQAAQDRLESLGATVSLDIVPGVGHEPAPSLLARLGARLA